MTENEVAEPTPGTAADYMRFLTWAGRTGELPSSTVTNWRIASIKVLEIEGDNWENVNVVDLDLDSHLRRFETLKRTSYASASMKAYKSRAKVGIEAYRGWFAGSDWKPKASGSTKQSRNGSKKPTGATAPPAEPPVQQKRETGGYVPHHAALIEYQLALRPGVRALLTLPEMLTKSEAVRIIRFVRGLAIIDRDEEIDDQLMITIGEASAE
jgi:hypothetical protein